MANLAGVVVSVVPPVSDAGVVEDYAAKVKDLENQVVPPVSNAGVVARGGGGVEDADENSLDIPNRATGRGNAKPARRPASCLPTNRLITNRCELYLTSEASFLPRTRLPLVR